MHGAWCWDAHFLGYFASHGFDAYAVNLRGHGNSEVRQSLRTRRTPARVAAGRRRGAGDTSRARGAPRAWSVTKMVVGYPVFSGDGAHFYAGGFRVVIGR